MERVEKAHFGSSFPPRSGRETKRKSRPKKKKPVRDNYDDTNGKANARRGIKLKAVSFTTIAIATYKDHSPHTSIGTVPRIWKKGNLSSSFSFISGPIKMKIFLARRSNDTKTKMNFVFPSQEKGEKRLPSRFIVQCSPLKRVFPAFKREMTVYQGNFN